MLYLIFVLCHVAKIWVVVFRFELGDINSFVNALTYGMRHVKHTKAYLGFCTEIKYYDQRTFQYVAMNPDRAFNI